MKVDKIVHLHFKPKLNISNNTYKAYDNGKQCYQENITSLNFSIYKCPTFKFRNNSIIYVPDDYRTIQLAINNSSPGDTIIVRDGTYVENLIVDKPLIIQSEHNYSVCTIEAKNYKLHVITITSDYVSIIGFKIQGLSTLGRAGIWHSNVNHITIMKNRLLSNDFASFGEHTSDNIIQDNFIHNNNWGIRLQYTNNNSISNNYVYDLDTYAVAIELNYANETKVYDNYFSGSYDLGLLNSFNNIIQNNTMNVGEMWAHIHMDNSSNNILQNNTFTQGYNYLNDGIEIYDASNSNRFLNNTLNKIGVFIFDSYHNIFLNNSVQSKPLIVLENVSDYTLNTEAGQLVVINCSRITSTNLKLSGINVGLELLNVKDSNIININISSNNFEGIYCGRSENVTFRNLSIGGNDCGIQIWQCENLRITSCRFSYYSNLVSNCICLEKCNNSVIDNDTFVGRDYDGLKINNSHYNTICFNQIINFGNGFTGFKMSFSNYNNIYQNNFNNNTYCVLTNNCNNNSIFYNVFKDNYWGPLISGNNKVFKNNFINDNLDVKGSNVIEQNNFIKCRASFESLNNHWNNNYWRRPRLFPCPILGRAAGFILLFQFDMNPALLPFKIPSID